MTGRTLIAGGASKTGPGLERPQFTAATVEIDQPPAFPDCNHPVTEARRRTLSNQTVQIVMQCLSCGRQTRAVKRDEIELRSAAARNPAFAPGIADAVQERWQDEFAQWRERQQERQAARSAAWWARYNDYLLTEEWRSKRALRLEKDDYECQAMLNGCIRRANEVHHLTYDHLFNEPLFDLISVCRSCHIQITAMNRELRGDT